MGEGPGVEETDHGGGRRCRSRLSGEDRYFLYVLAAATGFRASALAGLTPADFDLTSDSPVVTLPARLNKSRRVKVQPLPAGVAEAIRGYLAGKPVGSAVWPGGVGGDRLASRSSHG